MNMSALRRALIVLVAAGGATIALAAGPATARHTARTAAVPACSSGGIVTWLDTSGNGTAGSVYYKLEFTNLSGHSCTLSGYPGVSALGIHHHQLGSAASRDTAVTPRTVNLHNGATAKATLRIIDAGAFPPSSCHPVTAAGLRVYAPNQTKPKFVPFPFDACSRSGPVYLTIRAVQKDSSPGS